MAIIEQPALASSPSDNESFSSPKVRRERKKWIRKAPLMSAGPRSKDTSLDPGSMKSLQLVFGSFDKQAQSNSYDEIRERLLNFLSHAHEEKW